MAKRYVAKLFKEYALADLSRYKQGQVGLRWRVEREVIEGKVRRESVARELVDWGSITSAARASVYVDQVLAGTAHTQGQFICGNLSCDCRQGLGSYEVGRGDSRENRRGRWRDAKLLLRFRFIRFAHFPCVPIAELPLRGGGTRKE
jgi:hypothetical protein